MSQPTITFYDFDDWRVDVQKRALLCNGQPMHIPPRTFDMLLVLIENRHRAMSKNELLAKFWPAPDADPNNVDQHINALRDILSGEFNRQRHIKTFPRRGYQFIADVKEFAGGQVETTAAAPVGSGPLAKLKLLLGGHFWYAAAAAALYASLYAIELLVEIAYQFDRYGRAGLKITPLVFGWIFATSLTMLAIDWRQTSQGQGQGLTLSILILLASAGLLFGGLCLFLPPSPITQSRLQAHTAQAAYLKSLCYFLFLALFFLLIPFHFVISTQRDLQAGRDLFAGSPMNSKLGIPPIAAIFWRLWALVLLIAVMMAVTLFLHTNLMDNLIFTQYTNFFTLLIYARLIIYFSLGLVCLFWLYRELSRLKQVWLQLS